MATALDVSKYFLKLTEPDWGDFISNLKLQKLLYYAQGAHLAIYGEELFDEEIEAWEHGPVVPSVYHNYKDNRSEAIPIDFDFNANAVLEDHEAGTIEDVYDVYGQFSAWKLRNMTHEEGPWKDVFDRETRGQVIPKDAIFKFFSENLVE